MLLDAPLPAQPESAPRLASSMRTSGDFAAGLRARADAVVIGDFATGMRAPRAALPAAVADKSRSRPERAQARQAA